MYFLAALTQVNAWMGSLPALLKFNFFHPAFGRGAVCHRQCAVPWAEASADDVYPRRDYPREELKQIV
jgi:hypothetical protein